MVVVVVDDVIDGDVLDVVVEGEVVEVVVEDAVDDDVVVGFVTVRDGNCSWNVTTALALPVLFTTMVTGSLPEGLISGIGISVGMPERAIV